MSRFAGLTNDDSNNDNGSIQNSPSAIHTMPAMQLQTVAPTPVELTPGVSIVARAAEVAKEEQVMVRDILGLAMREDKQFFVNGTKMLSCGEAVAQNLRRQYEEEPTVGEAMESLIATIKGENRQDYTVPVKNLFLDRQGILQGVNGGVFLTENAFSNLVNNFRGKGQGADVAPRLRNNLNLWTHLSEKFAKIRTRNPQDSISVGYAALGARYSVLDLDAIAGMVAERMPQDAHATVLYKDASGTINVSLAPTFEAEELGVGRTHRIICSISSADDGSGSIKIRYKAVRIRCINCTTIEDERLVFSRKHIGDVQSIFSEALSKAGLAMEVFSQKWKEANERSIVDKNDGSALSAHETFKRLIAHGYVKVPGFDGPVLLDKLMESFDKEPGAGAAHINMAITRLAHEGIRDWKSPWVVEDLEQAAGNLLFQNVYQLRALTEKEEERIFG